MRLPKHTTVFWVLTVIWIACIFSFSAMPSAQSHQQSEQIQQAVQPVVDPVVSVFSPGFSLDNVLTRKLGHIAEYTLLGVLLCGALGTVTRKVKQYWMPATLLCIVVPLLDETIQIWSDRSASLDDVWLDLCSALIAFWAVTGLLRLILILRQKRKKEKTV